MSAEDASKLPRMVRSSRPEDRVGALAAGNGEGVEAESGAGV